MQIRFLIFISTFIWESFALILIPKCLTPTDTSGHRNIAVLFAGAGSGLGSQRYQETFSQLQLEYCRNNADTENVRLWVGILDYSKILGDTWLAQSQFDTKVINVMSELSHLVKDEKIPIYFGAHSARSVQAMQTFVSTLPSINDTITSKYLRFQQQQDTNDIHNDVISRYLNSGMILFGGTLTRSLRSSFPPEYPILTVGAELDGLFRIFRIAEEYHHSRNIQRTRPFAVLEGANYMSFVSDGHVPSFVKRNDFKAEIPQKEVNLKLIQLISSFISTHSLPEDITLKSIEYLRPIIQSFELEGSYHLRPPCNEVKNNTEDCRKGSKWSELMGAQMANIPNATVISIDEFKRSWSVVPYRHPELLNSCQSDTTGNDEKCTLLMNTYSQCTYPWTDYIDNGFHATSCGEIRLKMVSREQMFKAAGFSNPSFLELDDSDSICKGLIQQSINWAMENAKDTVKQRYLRKGIRLEAGEDTGPFDGGSWIWRGLEFERKGGVVQVKSPTVRTALAYPIPLFRGYHYCKVLSPARALEWIYFDSMR